VDGCASSAAHPQDSLSYPEEPINFLSPRRATMTRPTKAEKPFIYRNDPRGSNQTRRLILNRDIYTYMHMRGLSRRLGASILIGILSRSPIDPFLTIAFIAPPGPKSPLLNSRTDDRRSPIASIVRDSDISDI